MTIQAHCPININESKHFAQEHPILLNLLYKIPNYNSQLIHLCIVKHSDCVKLITNSYKLCTIVYRQSNFVQTPTRAQGHQGGEADLRMIIDLQRVRSTVPVVIHYFTKSIQTRLSCLRSNLIYGIDLTFSGILVEQKYCLVIANIRIETQLAENLKLKFR